MLCRRLGTSVREGAIDGCYGDARFLHNMSAPGILQYQIMLLRPFPRRLTPLDFVWRETSASTIADRLIEHYEIARRRIAS